MDFPAPTALSPAPLPRLGVAVAVVALAAYTCFLAVFVGAVAGASDSSGYLNHARLLASGHVHVAPRTLATLSARETPPYLYVPLGFKPAPNGDGLVPTYATGLPLFIAALAPLAGWAHAGDLVIILHSLAGLLATYLLARELGLGWRGALLATLMLGFSPLYLFMSLQAMSDLPSLVWTTMAVLAALRSRRGAGWALAAGAALALDVLLRPANILAFFPVAIAVGASPRRGLLLALGGLPGAVFFALYNHSLYGAYLTTGYGDSTTAFTLHWVPVTLRHYALWLPVLLSPLALAAVALPFVRQEPGLSRWLLVTWILAYAGFYCAYANTHETWWYLRFLLPAAPATVIGAVLVLRTLAAGRSWEEQPHQRRLAETGALILVIGSALVWDSKLRPTTIGRDELRYGIVSGWMERNLPSNAICLEMQDSGALFYYTHFTFLRWDEIKPDNAARVDEAVRRSGRPLYAILFPFELAEGALGRSLPGHWTTVRKVENVTVLRWNAPAANP